MVLLSKGYWQFVWIVLRFEQDGRQTDIIMIKRFKPLFFQNQERFEIESLYIAY